MTALTIPIPNIDTKGQTKMMDTVDALQIIISLARQNVLDAETCDPELREEAIRQSVALDVVEDFVVNNLGDD